VVTTLRRLCQPQPLLNGARLQLLEVVLRPDVLEPSTRWRLPSRREGTRAQGVAMSPVNVILLSPVRFSWQDDKAHSNARKHGVTFEEATTVFAGGPSSSACRRGIGCYSPSSQRF
jgi:hypothetical protein